MKRRTNQERCRALAKTIREITLRFLADKDSDPSGIISSVCKKNDVDESVIRIIAGWNEGSKITTYNIEKR